MVAVGGGGPEAVCETCSSIDQLKQRALIVIGFGFCQAVAIPHFTCTYRAPAKHDVLAGPLGASYEVLCI